MLYGHSAKHKACRRTGLRSVSQADSAGSIRVGRKRSVPPIAGAPPPPRMTVECVRWFAQSILAVGCQGLVSRVG